MIAPEWGHLRSPTVAHGRTSAEGLIGRLTERPGVRLGARRIRRRAPGGLAAMQEVRRQVLSGRSPWPVGPAWKDQGAPFAEWTPCDRGHKCRVRKAGFPRIAVALVPVGPRVTSVCAGGAGRCPQTSWMGGAFSSRNRIPRCSLSASDMPCLTDLPRLMAPAGDLGVACNVELTPHSNLSPCDQVVCYGDSRLMGMSLSSTSGSSPSRTAYGAQVS